MNKTQMPDEVPRRLSLLKTLLAASIVAAASQASAQTEASARQDSAAVLEEVVVTGSRIRKDTFTSSSPITTLSAETMGKVGETNLGNALARIPSITAGFSASNTTSNSARDTGINATSLRNLGTARTLVLVNGQRFVSGISAGSGYGVDLSAIPTAIIDRVEVLTGNQSAIYGSDAIAGVVNIITKTDFEGAALNVQVGQASEGDNDRTDISLTLGQNFGDNSNVWFNVGYSDVGIVNSKDRAWSAVSETSIDTDGDGLRDTRAFEGSSFIPGARLLGAGLSIKGDGTPFEGSRNLATTDRLNFYDFRTLLLPSESKFAAAGLTLNWSDKSTATMEFNYARVESFSQIEPLPLNTVTETFRTNRGGVTNIDLATHPLWAGSSAGAQFLAAGATSLDDIGNTFRRVVEFGQIGINNVRDTFRVAGSVDYKFDNGLRFDLSGTYGVTDQNQVNTADINLERAALALDIEPDGFGGFQCVDVVARSRGCVPYNPFGTIDSVAGLAGVTGFSAAARDYLEAQTGLQGNIDQVVVTAVLSGDLPFNIGSQDNIAFAAGVEYRRESGEEIPDGLRQKGLTRLLTIRPTAGDFDAVEIFGELQIPLADRLILDVAARIGDYSTVDTIGTFRVGLDAPINDSIRLRAAAGTAVRAPNISDLFAGRTNTAGLPTDPCNQLTAADTGNVAENCRSFAAIQNRIDTEGIFLLTQIESQQTRIFRAGSPSVQEETATSFTFGAIFTPQNWEALSIAVDYYNIEIEDAIRFADTDTVLTRCYDVAPSSFDQACNGEVLRDVNTGPLLDISNVANNEETINASGIDIEATYFFDELGSGDLLVALGANIITEYKVTGLSGDVADLKGEVLFPDFRLNLSFDYNVGDFNAFAAIRHRDSTLDRNDGTVQNANLNAIDSVTYVDLRGSYRLGDKVNVFFGLNNAFDEQAPRMSFSYKYLDGTASNGTAFDLVGRRWYTGVNVEF